MVKGNVAAATFAGFVVRVDFWELQKVVEKIQFPGLELKHLPEAGR